MSAVVLQGLLDYLKSTLTMDNRQWLAVHLIEPAEKLKPYTCEELMKETEAAVADFEAGRFYTEEEVEAEIDVMLEKWKNEEKA